MGDVGRKPTVDPLIPLTSSVRGSFPSYSPSLLLSHPPLSQDDVQGRKPPNPESISLVFTVVMESTPHPVPVKCPWGRLHKQTAQESLTALLGSVGHSPPPRPPARCWLHPLTHMVFRCVPCRMGPNTGLNVLLCEGFLILKKKKKKAEEKKKKMLLSVQQQEPSGFGPSAAQTLRPEHKHFLFLPFTP